MDSAEIVDGGTRKEVMDRKIVLTCERYEEKIKMYVIRKQRVQQNEKVQP